MVSDFPTAQQPNRRQDITPCNEPSTVFNPINPTNPINSINHYMNSFFWYPPAETKIPLKAFRHSFNRTRGDAEQAIRHTTGSTYCCFGPSGRALLYHLLVALKKRNQGRRGEVLIPGYTCYSVAAAVVKAGLSIRLYDLDQQTLNPDIQSIEANCNKHTLAVISQHLFGIPIDLENITAIATGLGAYHIEDAAQAFGGRDKGEPLGSKGDFGLFSFGRGKPMPIGAGGALISSKYNLNDLVPSFKSNRSWKPIVVSLLTQLAAKPAFYGLSEMLPLGLGETIFDPEFEAGGISALQTNLFMPMMPTFLELNRHRRVIASIYQHAISPQHLMSVPEPNDPIYPRFPVLAKNGNLAVELRRLGARRLYPNALHQEPKIDSHIVNADQKFPGAETLARELITLPTHHNINEKLAKIIADKVNRWIAKSG